MLFLALAAVAAPSLPSLVMSFAGLAGGAPLPAAAAALPATLVASGTAWIQKKDSKSGPPRSVGSIEALCWFVESSNLSPMNLSKLYKRKNIYLWV